MELELHVQEQIHVWVDIIAMELPAQPINPLRQLVLIAPTAKEPQVPISVYALHQLDINSVLVQHIIITHATLLIRILHHAWKLMAALTQPILPTLAANRAVVLNLRKLSLAGAPL